MNTRFSKLLALMLALALAATMAVGCGTDDEPDPGPDTGEEPAEVSIRAAMVTDTGGLGDASFNDLAWAALERARDELGAEVEAIQSNEVSDYEPNIDSLVGAGYELIMTVGALMGDTTTAKAPEYPEVNFIGIDQFYEDPAPNMLGLTFRENEGAFLAGVVAAMATTDSELDDRINDQKVIAFIGGMDIPPVERFEAGYRAGAAWVDPEIRVISAYVGGFDDEAKAKELALSAISQGADVVFAAAGLAGRGGITACQEAGALFIGVDADQYVTVPGSGDVMLTSSLKYMDVAAFDAIQRTVEGSFPGGQNLDYGLVDGAVGLAPFHDFEDSVSQEIRDKVAEAEAGILDGSIEVAATRDEL